MHDEQIQMLADAIAGADAVLIGAGAGLSSAAGFSYAGLRFEQAFPDFIARYRFPDMYAGGFYPFPPRRSSGPTGAAISGSTATGTPRAPCIRTCWSWCGKKRISS